MTNEKFNEILEEMIEHCKSDLKVKAEYYSGGEDRLLNFKRAAQLVDETPVKSLKGMMKKHTIKLYCMFEEMEKDNKIFDEKEWEEVLTDNINYLFLLKAMLIEEGQI